MIIFCTDESSSLKRSGEHKFCIYGGLLLSESKFKELAKFIYKLKDRYLLPQKLELKWRFGSVWQNMIKIGRIKSGITKESHPELFKGLKEDYDKIKDEILNKISQSKARIIVVIRPSELLQATHEKDIEYSIKAVAQKFEKILRKEKKLGIILADELPPKIKKNDAINYEYILDLCSSGTGLITLDYVTLIIPTIDSCISPAHQVNDIILGAIQYYILELIRKIRDPNWNMDIAKGLMKKIAKNFHVSSPGGYVINNGILLYPPKINRRHTNAGIFLDRLEKQLKIDFNIS